MALSIKDYTGPKIPLYLIGTLGAGEMRGIDGIGEKFYVVESDGILTIKTNIGTKNYFDQRQGENADRDALYERIEIYNETLAPITFKIFYGFGSFTDGRADIIGTVSITGIVPLPAGAATQATSAAILAKLIAAPSTEAKQDSLIAKLPAALDGGRLKIARNSIGIVDNAWAGVLTGAGGFSDSVDVLDAVNISAFGAVDGATDLEFEVSQDDITYYKTNVILIIGAALDFHFSLVTSAKYVRLSSTNNVTASATITAK